MKITFTSCLQCISCLMLMLPLHQVLDAQQVIWANNNNIDKRTDFTKVIGQNKYGVYVLKHKSSTFRRYFILEHFDKKMNLLKSKTFKIPNSELEKIVVHTNGIIFFTKEYSKGYAFKLIMQGIDSGFNELPPKTIVSSQNFNDETVTFNIEYNTSRNRFLIWYLIENKDVTSLRFHLCNRQTEMLQGESLIPHKLSEVYVGDAAIDDTGNLYLAYSTSEKFKSKNASDFRHKYFCLNVYTGKTGDRLINNEQTFINSYKLCYNPKFATMALLGLYGDKDEDDNKGYFFINVNCRNFEILISDFFEIERKIVGNIIGVKNEQKGENLTKFKIKKVIPKVNGGILLITERSYITTQSDIFYVNGIPQSSYAKIFNNDEVLIMDLDSSGAEKWNDVINKNQSSINDGGYYNGIVVMVNDDQVNILYNDKLNANADIIQVTYKPNGVHSKKILLNNEQYYALVIPSEYNQVTANSIVIPINQNREFTYIKLLY